MGKKILKKSHVQDYAVVLRLLFALSGRNMGPNLWMWKVEKRRTGNGICFQFPWLIFWTDTKQKISTWWTMYPPKWRVCAVNFALLQGEVFVYNATHNIDLPITLSAITTSISFTSACAVSKPFVEWFSVFICCGNEAISLYFIFWYLLGTATIL